MNKISEAYQKLEVQESISDEDLKKSWRSLAKKYHPDVYRDDPNKLKEINEAYQLIKDYRENPHKHQEQDSGFPFGVDLGDIFSNFHGFTGFNTSNQQQNKRSVKNINLKTEISFEESVIGVEKEFEIEREIKCEPCDGNGFIQKKNNCTNCDGYGKSSMRQGNTIFNSTCSKCRGKVEKQDCDSCKKKTFSVNKTTMKVKIPAGVRDSNTIQLQGAGNFAGHSMFGDAYSNVFIDVSVKNNTLLTLDGNDVVFNLSLSLLEALEGCVKIVPTVKGEQEIKINSGVRNKEEIIIPNRGIKLIGNQRVILDVSYPENKEKLIEILKGQQ